MEVFALVWVTFVGVETEVTDGAHPARPRIESMDVSSPAMANRGLPEQIDLRRDATSFHYTPAVYWLSKTS
jgi:hypothetical protein